MDCANVASELVAYRFETCDASERDAIDAHLLECQACLRAYLALKRATDLGARPREERASPEVKTRLRAEVARRYGRPSEVATPRRGRPLLLRKIPVYQGLVAVALAAAIALLVPAATRRAAVDVHDGVPEVDTSRSRAESLHIY